MRYMAYKAIKDKRGATMPQEFFSHTVEFHPKEDRCHWLMKHKKLGMEFTTKLMIPHLINRDVYDWCIDFYKDAEVIKLTRRDKYRAFLSTAMLYHGLEAHTKDLSSLKIPTITVKEESFSRFLYYDQLLDLYPADVEWVYEDLTDEFLRDYFGVYLSPDQLNTPYHSINYEDYITNIDEVKGWFEELHA